jgi:hypothetical protein
MNREVPFSHALRGTQFIPAQQRPAQQNWMLWASSLMLLAAFSIWQFSLRSSVRAAGAAITAAPAAAAPVAQSGSCNNCCGTWGQKSNTGPSPRDLHAMAYARACNRVVLFGGRYQGGIPPAIVGDETWEWNGNTMTWTQFFPATRPAGRNLHAMAYDAARNEVVLFGGYNVNFGGLNDTWVYSCNTHTWTQKTPATSPAIRHGHSMAYDPNLQVVVMYGGGSNKEDTWTWNGTNWTQISATSPPGIRHEHAMAFDGTRVILFGGSKNAGNADNDTWGFTGSTWTMLAPNGSGPNKRYRHAMAQDPGCRKVILFGGDAEGIGYANDTWEWNGATLTWCQVSVSGTPPSPARIFPAMAYDGRGALMHGGLNSGQFQQGDTWRFTCSRQYTYRAGRMDNFSYPTPTDPLPAPRADFLANVNAFYGTPPRKHFDDPANDKWLLHSFSSLPANIVKAELEVRLKPGTGDSSNDSIHFDFPPFNAPFFTWGQNIRNLHSGGTWNPGESAITLVLDLCNLPAGGSGQPTNLISQLNTHRSLHIMIQDDTIVDYMKLRVTVCPPRLRFAGLPHEPLNNASLEILTSPTGTENLRSVPPDIRVDLGNATGWTANLLPTTDLRSSGAVLESWVKGRVGGVDNQFIGKSAISGNGTSATFTADFSTIGSTNSLVQLLDPNGQMVGTFTAPNAAAIQFMCPSGTQPVTICNTQWVCEANGDRAEVRFCNTTCASFGGQTYNNVSTMRVTALGITQTREFVSEGVLCGANIGPLTVTGESVQVGTRSGQAAGRALLEPGLGGSVAVTNLGSSGEDGITFPNLRYGTVIWQVDSIDPMASAPVGAAAQFSTSHVLTTLPTPPARKSSVTVRKKIPTIFPPGEFDIAIDFSALGSDSVRVLAFSGNTPVADLSNYAGTILSNAWPDGVTHTGTTTLGYELNFTNGATLAFGPCPPAPCDQLPNVTQLRVLPQNPNVTVSHLNEASLFGSELPEITVAEFGGATSCNSDISLSPTTLPNTNTTAAYHQTITASGGTAPYGFAVTAGTLNAGLSLDPLTGVISGTPTGPGSSAFTITATDDLGCTGNREYTITVVVCEAITVNPLMLANGFVGTPHSQAPLTAAGGTAPYSFAVTVGTLPPGVMLASNGSFSGTPTTIGSFSFTAQATDNNGCSGTRRYTVIISGSGLMFYPLATPVRLLDTRPGASPNACSQPNAPLTGGASRTQPGRNLCTIPATAQALTGNITTVQSGGGYLTLYPSGATQPFVSNTNFNPNQVLNNGFTVGLGTDGAFKIFATSNTDVVVDITGYYAPPSVEGLYFHPLPKPIRVLDTRPSATIGFNLPGVPLAGNADTAQQGRNLTYDGVTIPATAQALVGNATTVNPGGGYLTLYPQGTARPFVASSNYNAGDVMNAPFTVGLGASGNFMMYVTSATHLVVDVLGYYSADAVDANGAGLLFSPLPTSARLLDTRASATVGCYLPGAALLAGSTRTQAARGVCTVPANAQGIVGNATTVNPGSGYLTFFPSSATQPFVASSNFTAGQVFNRHFTVGLGASDGAFKIFTTPTTDLVVDVSGYFAP